VSRAGEPVPGRQQGEVEKGWVVREAQTRGSRGCLLTQRLKKWLTVHTSSSKVHHCDVPGHRGRMSRDVVDATSSLRLVAPGRIQRQVTQELTVFRRARRRPGR
jgi:hypothetical protein